MDVPQGSSAPKADQANPGANPGSGSEANTLTEQTVNELVNRAITARLKPFGEKLDKSLGELTAGFTARFEEFGKTLESLKPKEPDKPKDKAKDADPLAENPQWQAMQKTLADQQKKLEAAERKALDAENKRREAFRRQTTDEALVKYAGVDPKAVRAARALLESDGRIKLSEDGETILYVDGEEERPLAEGLKAWAKQEEAKIYLPPRGTAGSGDRGGGQASPAGSKDPESRKREIGESLFSLL